MVFEAKIHGEGCGCDRDPISDSAPPPTRHHEARCGRRPPLRPASRGRGRGGGSLLASAGQDFGRRMSSSQSVHSRSRSSDKVPPRDETPRHRYSGADVAAARLVSNV